MSEWQRLTVQDLMKCSGKTITVDIETTGLEWWSCHIIGVGIWCPDADIRGYIPTLDVDERQTVKQAFRELAPGTTLIAHNIKFELHFLELDPFIFPYRFIDTAVMAHLLDSRYKKSLVDLERIFMGTSTKKAFVDRAPHGKKNKIWEWPLDLVAPYCINDCRLEHELYEILLPKLEEMVLTKLLRKEMKYMEPIWDSEHYGIKIDVDFVVKATQAVLTHERALEQDLFDAVGYQFNWRSTKQLSKALYEDMGIPKPKNPYADADGVDRSKFADKGLYKSTCTSTFLLMEKVKHPLGLTVSQIRESALLRTNNLQKWLELRDSDDVIHSNFNMTGTRTGRLSSSHPALQNVPSHIRTRHTQSVYSAETSIRSEEYNLRQAFIPRPGNIFISVDYSQMEMRMFGLLSEDPFMLDSLARGADIHADIAEKVWGMRDPVHREWSKTISFGLIYGMTTGSLMHRLNMSPAEARKITQDYWNTFPRIQPWINDTIEECRVHGYVRYWSGRLWREEDPRFFYKGANASIQGGCADLLSIAAIRVYKWLRNNVGDKAHIVNYIHDELLVEVPEEAVDDTARAMGEIMALPDIFQLPWKTSTKVGKSYGSLEPYGEKVEY